MNDMLQWAAIIGLALWLLRLQAGSAATNLVTLLSFAGRGIEAIIKYLGGTKT